MAFELTTAEKETVANLTKTGFSESMATVAVAAQRAGHEKAVEHIAEIVKALSKDKNKNQQEADIKASRKRITDELASLEGRRDFAAIQRRISLKRALSKTV